MGKHIMVYLYRGILLSNQIEHTSVICNTMSQSSYKWNNTVCTLVSLAQHNDFDVHLGLLEFIRNNSQPLIVYISSQLYIQWYHVGSLKLPMLGVFISWKLANAMQTWAFGEGGVGRNQRKLIFYFNIFKLKRKRCRSPEIFPLAHPVMFAHLSHLWKYSASPRIQWVLLDAFCIVEL